MIFQQMNNLKLHFIKHYFNQIKIKINVHLLIYIYIFHYNKNINYQFFKYIINLRYLHVMFLNQILKI